MSDTMRSLATLNFDASIRRIGQINAPRCDDLERRGKFSVRQLLQTYPRRYIDMSELRTIAQAQIGTYLTCVGHIHKITSKRPRFNLSLVEIDLFDETGLLKITCFRQPWLLKTLSQGMKLAVSGQLEFNYGFKRMVNPHIEVLDEVAICQGLVLPVHPASAKINAQGMRRVMHSALGFVEGMEDPLPVSLRNKYQLMSRMGALRCVHEPQSLQELHEAHRRLRYEELLMLQLHLIQMRHLSHEGVKPVRHTIEGPALKALEAALPFSLTQDQLQARDEILASLAKDEIAEHLLLGDVGSGKTIVAAFALAAAKDTFGQVLMMAPTEVLARQYPQALGEFLEKAQISYALVTGSTPKEERADITTAFAQGDIDVLFGTHALLENDVIPYNLSLVVIDEQHRFGVEQRQALTKKSPQADLLSLSATPIPRSLALALYGDVQVSRIKTKPFSQAVRSTKLVDVKLQGEAYEQARAALEQGRQAYVICPLVGVRTKDEAAYKTVHDIDENSDCDYVLVTLESEESLEGDQVPLKSAQAHAKYLEEKIFSGFSVGLLHGRMSTAQKHAVMDDFYAGKIDVLVSTTVVEVGVDVPNATVMIIEDADRFGLSQLHQLRGRVGRGEFDSQVFLISATRNPQALRRLEIMESCEDGFELAHFDLSLRREGDVLGIQQSGASRLQLVNVIRDEAYIKAAYEDAYAILEEDLHLSSDMYTPLARELAVLFKKKDSDSCE